MLITSCHCYCQQSILNLPEEWVQTRTPLWLLIVESLTHPALIKVKYTFMVVDCRITDTPSFNKTKIQCNALYTARFTNLHMQYVNV